MAKFYPIEEVVDDLCLRSGDILKRNKGLYLSLAKDVWDDLNEDTLKIADKIKIPVRRIYSVDKRTNSINIPNNILKISSLHSIDRYGCYSPIYRNDKISDDIVELGADKNCACENNCNGVLCNTIKGYEAVETMKPDFLPNGDPISFKCVDKKIIDNGILYEQTQYPLRMYVSGVWTSTIKYTENRKLCEVDLETNGCVCETEANLDTICNACGINESDIYYGGTSITPPVQDADTWIYHCASKMEWFNIQCGGYPYKCGNGYNNIYNISELGDRIIFPSNFGWDKIMIRGFIDISLRDLKIPYLAKETFMTGMQYFASTNHDKKQQLSAFYSQKYSKQKWGLLLTLNKNTIAEQKQIFTPKAFMPSYIENRNYGNGEYY